MNRILLLVESPAKCKTIKSILEVINKDNNYEVLATYGHILKIKPDQSSIDIHNNFATTYEPIEKNKGQVTKICKAAKDVNTVILATDLDREGEDIANDVKECLVQNGYNGEFKRIVFSEITHKSLAQALDNPRDIDISLVQAQKTRACIDFLVGFYLSPVLWKKLKIVTLSAGRVQSPTLRMIYNRKKAVDNFIPTNTWSITSTVKNKEAEKLQAQLHMGKNAVFKKQEEADKCLVQINKELDLCKYKLVISQCNKRDTKTKPPVPLKTSTLQRIAGTKLGLTAKQCMDTAQSLYENGHITYMRTDSSQISDYGLNIIKQEIEKRWGRKALRLKANVNKDKASQEAHEAIRPTDMNVHTVSDGREAKLYELIYQISIASQMQDCVSTSYSYTLQCNDDCYFTFSQSYISVLGWKQAMGINAAEIIKPLQEGDVIYLSAPNINAHTTKPEPHFNEGSLIEQMEKLGIGRPSTYASTVEALTRANKRQPYAEINNKKELQITDLGMLTSNFLQENFPKYVSAEFTAELEQLLDKIAHGQIYYLEVINAFWEDFFKAIREADSKAYTIPLIAKEAKGSCPKCQSDLQEKMGRYGKFIACSGYPNCKYIQANKKEEQATDKQCTQCQQGMFLREGQYGKYYRCPTCKINLPYLIDIPCPECKGPIAEKKYRNKTTFYCSQCKFNWLDIQDINKPKNS